MKLTAAGSAWIPMPEGLESLYLKSHLVRGRVRARARARAGAGVGVRVRVRVKRCSGADIAPKTTKVEVKKSAVPPR